MDHISSRTEASDAAQAVLLDLDGTLIASRDGITKALRLAMADLGHVLDPSLSLDWVIGPPLHDSFEKMLGERGDDRVVFGVQRYRHHYEEGGMMLDSPAFDGIEAALETLAGSGLRLLLATSKPLHMATRILERRGLARFFAGLYGANADDSGAEKPELIARLIEAERVDPRRAVMVGDRRFDIAGAHANRMRALGVLWGYGGGTELEQAGADALVETPDRLAEAVQRMLGITAAPSVSG